MIKSITAINPKGEELILELTRPDKTGLAVKSVTGLGPPKATLSSSSLATSDGSINYGVRADNRNVVLNLGIIGNPSVEDSRLLTYQYFPLKKEITLRIETDRRYLECSGHVESNEPNIFSKGEDTQISIVCTDPRMYAVGGGSKVFSGVMPMFEFPFENPVNSNDLIFGEIKTDNRAELYYYGDADTGVEITLHFFDEAEHITIYNIDTHESMEINTDRIKSLTGAIPMAGDDIIIDTRPGQKGILLLRNGIYTNIISCLSKTTDWFTLTSGANQFGFIADEGQNEILITFSYRNAYWGI